jgi:CelD/BcsL family acetyltransferase involved in cellulose biosynthesis
MQTTSKTQRIKVKKLSTIEELESLREQWKELLCSCANPNIFSTWEWQYQCARLLSDEKNLFVLTAHDNDELVSVLPLRKANKRFGGLIPGTTLTCLGGQITDYNVLLVRKHYSSSVIPLLTDYLLNLKLPLDFQNVLRRTDLYNLVKYMVDNGSKMLTYESKNALWSNLCIDYESFVKNLSKKLRKNLRLNQNRMDRAGGYTFQSEEANDTLLNRLIQLHTSRWEHRGQKGALAQKQIQSFHAELQKMRNKPFEIKYSTIRHEGEIIAILYLFVFNSCCYAYLSGFDMNHSRISPGNMIINYSIREAIQNGFGKFDMMRGDMKYKHSWATEAQDIYDTLLFPPSFYASVLYSSMNYIQAVKSIVPKPVKKKLKSILDAPQ